MSLKPREMSQLVEDLSRHDPFRNWRQRNDQMRFRSLYVKHDPQLSFLVPMFERKIKTLSEQYERIRDGFEMPHFLHRSEDEALAELEAKIRRLALKLRDTNTEIRGRRLDALERNPIGTEYFIDLDGGNNGNDGLTPGTAWLTIEQYTTTTVRSPGDIAWVRAGTSEIYAANIVSDEDGTKAQPIYIIGCSAGSGSGSDAADPWGDDIDTRPILDANGNNARFDNSRDHFWTIENMDFKSTLGAGSPCCNVNSFGVTLRNCRFYDSKHATSAAYGLTITNDHISQNLVEDCEFFSNRTYGVFHIGGIIYRRCKFDGNIGGYTYTQGNGLYVSSGVAFCQDCDFGQTSPHSTNDFAGQNCGIVILKNCRVNKFGVETRVSVFWDETTFDDLPTLAARGNKQHYMGIVEESDEVPVSGVNYSVKMVPEANAASSREGMGFVYFQTPLAWPGPLRLWLPAGDYSIKIPIRAISAYAAYPTAAELYIRARYNDDPSGNSFGEVISDEVLSDATTWVDFEVTVPQAKDGFVYIDVVLTKYQATKGIYVYPFPEVVSI